MVVAVDDVFDRNLEACGELPLEPFREVRVDGVREDDAFLRNQEYGAVIVVGRCINVTVDALERAPRRRGRGLAKGL